MRIVDSQVHIWTLGTPISHHRQLKSYWIRELLPEMASAGVDAALLHPPIWDSGGNELAVDAHRRHPDKFAVVGWFDPTRPGARDRVQAWKKRPGMLGLRFSFLGPGQDRWLKDGVMDWVWPAAERAGIPVGLLVPEALDEAEKIAARHPGLNIFIDHLARRRHSKDDAAFADLDRLLNLAKYPNVAVKASALPTYSSDVYPYRNIHSYIRRTIDAFGPDRVFWGSDLTRLPCTYKQAVTMFTEEMPWLKGRDLERVMGGALCDWLGWKIEKPVHHPLT